ncbi:fibronectin type III domain-containing protein [Paenibacillus hodogayensis]|uniref:Fibronectin type III domain-containing protein n=1 Tax=Paenibacillus hodogayensis TaxID=279208 RepID=A0ABV5VWG4_9BACL
MKRKWLARSLTLLVLSIFLLAVPARAAETWSQYALIGPAPSSQLGGFKFPSGVAVDGSGNVYVADQNNHRIQKYDAAAQTWSTVPVSPSVQLNTPVGVAVDQSGGTLLVAEYYGNRIQRLDVASNTWSSWSTGFNKPLAVALDGSGNAYAADTDNNLIKKLPAGSNTWSTVGSAGSAVGQFNKPRGMAVDGQGRLYVADSGNNRIQVLDGSTWSVWASGAGTALGQFSAPGAVAIGADGTVYVADSGNNRIQKRVGSTWTEWKKSGGGAGTGPGEFNYPSGIAVDASGQVYVADNANNRVQKLNGSVWSEWSVIGPTEGSGNGQFKKPMTLAVDASSGAVYVADQGNNRIQKLLGGSWTSIGGYGTGNGQFQSPAAVAVDGSGNLYIADTRGNRIQKLSAGGVFLQTWGKAANASGTAAGEFNLPEGVAVDGSGNIYVADTQNNRVQKLTISNGQWSVWGKSGNQSGNALGEFYKPTGVAVDSAGNVYVGDTSNNRIQKRDAVTGQWSEWKKGGQSRDFRSPHQVTVDGSGNVYVADVANNRIHKLTASTNTWRLWGEEEGSALGQFSNPHGIAVDASGAIYVADTNNQRVQKLVITLTAPDAPTGASAQPGNGKATVSFTAPADDGGSPITGYTVTSSPGGFTASGAASPLVVTGLTNQTAYTFTVVATNAQGDSLPSTPTASITPANPPSAPTGVTAQASGSGQATVSFTPPADNGGSPITSYKVTSSPGGVTALGGAAATSIPISNLTNGTAYTFTVEAFNAIGTSGPSDPSASITPVGPPGSPTGASAQPGNGQATVSFTTPANNGGSAITSYKVTSIPGGATASGAASPITVTGLTNGTAYMFTVVATNELGDSLPSFPSASVTPANLPDAPTGVTATTTAGGQATISFTPPANNGGSAITGYKVVSSPDGRTGTGATSPIAVTGLTNGTAYTFTVVATNAIGDSAFSEPSNSVTPTDKPDAPVSVTAQPGNGQATVSFTPGADGGSPVSGYTVTAQPGGATATGTTSPITVAGLTNLTAYTFTVVAHNAQGDSQPSAPSAAVIPAAPPNVPTGVTATAENGQAIVSFTPPANNGGSTITGYKVTSSPDGRTASGIASPITVTGLTNGTAYTFTVVATNAIGDSPSSASSGSVTPVAQPNVPTGVTAIAGNGQVTISFTPPADDGGSAITGYMVTSSPGGRTAGGINSPITVTGLTNGTTYTFTVVAQNAKGDSPPSASTSATPTNPPAEAPVLQSSAAGDGHVTLVWNAVAGSTGYKVYQSVESGSYGSEMTTVSGNVYSYTATGLFNGTTYYFVVKATNPGGDSTASNEASATPQVASPGAPVLQAPVAGNGQVTLSWNPVAGSTGYKVYQSVSAATYGNEVATVGGAVYGYTATGLANGTTYYFVVKAVNPGGESAASNQVSAMPVTVPSAPTNVTATEGDGTAVVVFAASADDGGSAITGYEVTASPGNIVSTGSASPITVTGLANDTTYTFTVKAINGIGRSAPSAASNAVTPRSASTGDGGGGGTANPPGSAPSVPAAPQSPAPGTGADVLINGKAEKIGTATTTSVNGQSVTNIAIDPKKLEEKLGAEGSGAVITIQVAEKSDVVIGELNGQMVKNMEQKQAVVEVKTEKATYTLPAQQININAISEQLGKAVSLQDIKIRIEIAVPPAETVKVVDNAAARGEFTVVVPPLNFTVKAIYGDTTIELSQFNAYVERTVAIPDGVDPSKITTAVVIEPDGTVRHVPTQIIDVNGKRYAKVNSLTNSTYSIVWHPLEFRDVAGHWAKDAVNDMGSRMIVSGTGDNLFQPDQDMTRAEFAAIIVNGLGLKLEKGATPFSDVKAPAWYSEVIQTAYSNRLISGFEDGTFRPMDPVTREQAMAMMANAMKITGLKAKLPAQGASERLGSFADANRVSEWAASGIADCLQAGIVSGRADKQLAPKEHITRAEVAILIQKLLQRSELI